MQCNRTGQAVIVALMLPLAGCSYMIKIAVGGLESGKPTFALTETSLPIVGRTPNVTEVYVYETENGRPNEPNPIWAIDSPKGVRLSHLTYAEVPTGFKESVPPKVLQPGATYQIAVRAWGSAGWQDFTVQ